jgi:hypothetical protein
MAETLHGAGRRTFKSASGIYGVVDGLEHASRPVNGIAADQGQRLMVIVDRVMRTVAV